MMVIQRPRSKRPSIMVRARVPSDTAKRLRKLAKEKGTTESELIREAIELLERRERRARGIEKLISLIPDEVPTKEDYAGWEGRP